MANRTYDFPSAFVQMVTTTTTTTTWNNREEYVGNNIGRVGSADRSHEMPYDEMGHAACVSEIIYNICICRQGGQRKRRSS